MGLQNEQGYPHDGMINFVNNHVDPFTGTITTPRHVSQSHARKRECGLLSAGMFVRIRIPLGKPHPALLVTDRAIGTDQSLKFVYAVDAENKIRYQRVTLGALQDDGLRVVEDGLTKDDWVVVSGLQQVQARMVVSPEREPMPIPVAEAEAAAKAAETTRRPGARQARGQSGRLQTSQPSAADAARGRQGGRQAVRPPPAKRSP